MNALDTLLAHNREFVDARAYESLKTDRFPDKGLAILACMDARLVELLPKAMGVRNGDAKIIKNAGALVTSAWGSVMRSLLVAVYNLRAEEIVVVAHHDCGMGSIDPQHILSMARERGISQDTISTLRYAGINLEAWLKGFDNVEESVRTTVQTIRNHPLLPKDVPVHGLIIHPDTGKLEVVVNGYT
ncbi:MAG: beta-class carbonic anhydrase [Roseiflexaceae bacterium]|nr:carbonic anhydrase [Chloroflexaceae bacterium]MCE2851442.1 carbonic anhydrase [Chloroflexaceae bacterium]